MDSSSPEVTGPAAALSNSFSAAVELAGKSVVEINSGRRFRASGVHWRQGTIVTAAHALRHEEDIKVTIAGGRSLPAKLAGRDGGSDLAVLSLDAAELPVTQIAGSSPAVGQVVLAVGRVDGLASASLGIVSLITGPWRTWRGALIDQLIRPDIALYHGFSGGPLVDAQGQTIGINTSGLSRYSAVTIPASTINRVADELSKTGRVARGFLGLGLYGVRIPRRIMEAQGLASAAGLIIVNVEPDGPADKAGLLVGDLLIALNGVPVKETEDVQAALDPDLTGKPVVASILRGGLPLEVSITVGERPHRRC
jgi:S1-C subfamily serine protease